MKASLVKTDSSEIQVAVSGRIDADAEIKLEKFIFGIKSFDEKKTVVLDFEQTEYISSAGLRFLLKIMKTGKDLRIVNAPSDVYDVFEMTGFTELCSIQKAYRQVDVSGCKVIGAGANGIIYRLDSERILKLYTKPNVLDSIIREKTHAKFAFLQGIPTAISFDIVKVGEKFGSIFELLEAKSVATLFIQQPETLDRYIEPYTNLLKVLHSTPYVERDGVQLTPYRTHFKKYVDLIKERCGDNLYTSLCNFLDGIPESNTMLHGDCHPFNVLVTKEEMVFIDMDTLTYGNPIFDLGTLYSSIIVLDKFVPEERRLYKCPDGLTNQFWEKTFYEYFKNSSETEQMGKLSSSKVIAYTLALAFSLRHPNIVTKNATKCTQELLEKAISEYTSER